jgi:hypothetical protein
MLERSEESSARPDPEDKEDAADICRTSKELREELERSLEAQRAFRRPCPPSRSARAEDTMARV